MEEKGGDGDFPYNHFLKTPPPTSAQVLKLKIPEKRPSSPSPKKGEPPLDKLIKIAKEQPFNTEEGRPNKFLINFDKTEDDLISSVHGEYYKFVDKKEEERRVDPKKTFENFIIGPFNQMSFNSASAMVDEVGNKRKGQFPCLYIHGGSGLGKTHILHAVANQIQKKYPQVTVALTSANKFMREMIDAIRQNKMAEFQKKYGKKVDFLMIDDIHDISGDKARTQEEFFHIFEELHKKGKSLIFTSDRHPAEIEKMEDRIKTRLQWGLITEIQRPDFETRMAILKKKAHEMDLFLSESVLALVAEHITSNIRELEGSIVQLAASKDIMKWELDKETVSKALKITTSSPKKSPKRPHRGIDFESITEAVAQNYKVSLEDIISGPRAKMVVLARQLAIYLSKKIVPHSTLKELSSFFRKSHPTIIHSIEKISKESKTSGELGKRIDAIAILLEKKANRRK